VEKAVNIVKNLEPGGFGSLNPAEFLLFQYNKKNIEKPLLKEMLTDYIDDIAKNKILNISSKLGVTPNDIQKNIDYIRKSFKPYPAWGIATENTEYIKIDATITENGNIIMHTKYRQLDVMDKEAFEKYISKFDDKKTVEFLKKQYEKASLLVENYYSRKSLFEQILNVIYERQKSFFEGGHLSALTQTEMSEILGVNVSTVSRAVNGKYIRIPSGIYEVASFFVNISTGDTSQDEAINVIKKIISEENKKKPLSDDDIASILKKEHNIDIKRRTVTKYREKEGIPSSRQRRVY
jgi:RNA polymerase sigma-54 factor